jgi:hypothetical protein
MSALTIASTAYPQVESLGSLKLMIIPLTTLTSSDTYTIEAGSPVVDYWTAGHVGTAGYAPDVTYTNSTGVFLLTSAQQGLITLFILMRT